MLCVASFFLFLFRSWPVLLKHLLKHSLLPSPVSKSLAHSHGVCFCFLFASARFCPTVYERDRPGFPDPSLCFVFLCPSSYKPCHKCKCTKHTNHNLQLFRMEGCPERTHTLGGGLPCIMPHTHTLFVVVFRVRANAAERSKSSPVKLQLKLLKPAAEVKVCRKGRSKPGRPKGMFAILADHPPV